MSRRRVCTYILPTYPPIYLRRQDGDRLFISLFLFFLYILISTLFSRPFLFSVIYLSYKGALAVFFLPTKSVGKKIEEERRTFQVQEARKHRFLLFLLAKKQPKKEGKSPFRGLYPCIWFLFLSYSHACIYLKNIVYVFYDALFWCTVHLHTFSFKYKVVSIESGWKFKVYHGSLIIACWLGIVPTY